MPPISIYDPRTMLEAVRSMKPARSFLLDTFFPTPRTFPTEVVDIDYYKGRRLMAPFVSPRKAGKVRERDGFVTKTFKPPLVKPARILTADDLKKRSMGEHIYSGKSPDERAAEFLAQDLVDMDAEITRREEWMAAQIKFTGQAHMIGDGVDAVLDFGFDQLYDLNEVEGGVPWDSTGDPKPDILADLKKYRLMIIQNSGVTPDVVLMASDVVDVFIRNEQVQKLLDVRRIELGKIEPRALPNGVTYIGQIASLGLDIYSYDEWYLDEDENPEDPEEKPMVPSGHVLIDSTRAKSTRLYGAVTVIEDDGAITYEGTRIPRSWTVKEPSSRFIQLNSCPLLVPHEVDSWCVLKVLEDDTE